MCSDRRTQRYSQKRFLEMVSNDFDITEAATAARRNYSGLPCGGLSAVSQFLAESSLHFKVKLYYDVDPALKHALAAMRGDVAHFHLGPAGGG